MIKYLIFLFIILFSSHVIAVNMTYSFSSPSFSGVGTSAHFLTIENQEHTRKAEIKAKRASEEAKRKSDAKNTNYNKFLQNMESRIYAEFSKQLTDAMFGEKCGTTYDGSGTIVPPSDEVNQGDGGGSNCTGTMTFNDTTITYTKDITNDQVVLVVSGPDGESTITLPLNDFQF